MNKCRTLLFIKLIIFLNLILICLSAFALDIEKDFVRKFNLLKKEDHYLPSIKTSPVLSKINLLKEPAKIFIIKNKIINDQDLLLFYIQATDSCHGCPVELWLYNKNKKPSVVQLAKDSGNSGEPPALLEIIIKSKHIYFLFKSTFEGQGVAESSLELIQYNLEKPKANREYFSFLSDTSFADQNPNCTGWSTKYEINNEKISFEKSGFKCDTNFELDKCRNSTKVQKKDFYEFENDE
jgi:hypothetical protein